MKFSLGLAMGQDLHDGCACADSAGSGTAVVWIWGILSGRDAYFVRRRRQIPGRTRTESVL